jgi:hypothetical protein
MYEHSEIIMDMDFSTGWSKKLKWIMKAVPEGELLEIAI